jgi:hypothetical protein
MNRKENCIDELENDGYKKNKGTYFYDDITTPIYTQGLGHKDNIVKY